MHGFCDDSVCLKIPAKLWAKQAFFAQPFRQNYSLLQFTCETLKIDCWNSDNFLYIVEDINGTCVWYVYSKQEWIWHLELPNKFGMLLFGNFDGNFSTKYSNKTIRTIEPSFEQTKYLWVVFYVKFPLVCTLWCLWI